MIDLRLGDCLEVLKTIPDKSVDLVVIDPPYIKKGNGYYCGGGAFGGNNSNRNEFRIKNEEI